MEVPTEAEQRAAANAFRVRFGGEPWTDEQFERQKWINEAQEALEIMTRAINAVGMLGCTTEIDQEVLAAQTAMLERVEAMRGELR